MAYVNKLHEALSLLDGGDDWFKAEQLANELRKLGAPSVHAEDIVNLQRIAVLSAADLDAPTGFFCRRYDSGRWFQVRPVGETATVAKWPPTGEGTFKRRLPLAASLRDRVEEYVATAARKTSVAALLARDGSSGVFFCGSSIWRIAPHLRFD